MYRSNDIVQFDNNFIYVRPFVKVGEPAESVKVFKFYLQDTQESARPILMNPEEGSNGPDKTKSKSKQTFLSGCVPKKSARSSNQVRAQSNNHKFKRI